MNLKQKDYCLTHRIQSAFVIKELKDKATTPIKISSMLLTGGAVRCIFYLGVGRCDKRKILKCPKLNCSGRRVGRKTRSYSVTRATGRSSYP